MTVGANEADAAYRALYDTPALPNDLALPRAYPPASAARPAEGREPMIAAGPPKGLRPALTVICTDGGRHRRMELLRVALVRDADGHPMLVQRMSPQRGRDAPWAAVEVTVGAADGHNVLSKRCPLCGRHLKRRVAPLTEAVAAVAGDKPLQIDVSR